MKVSVYVYNITKQLSDQYTPLLPCNVIPTNACANTRIATSPPLQAAARQATFGVVWNVSSLTKRLTLEWG